MSNTAPTKNKPDLKLLSQTFHASSDANSIHMTTILINNRQALKVLSQWGLYNEEPIDPGSPMPEKAIDRWAWMWDCFDKYPENIRVAAGIGHHEYRTIVDQLVNARLVFPHGELHPAAKRVLVALMANEIS